MSGVRTTRTEPVQTHKGRQDPLPQGGADLLEANGFLLSVQVKVKLLRSAGQEPLREHRKRAEEGVKGGAAAACSAGVADAPGGGAGRPPRSPAAAGCPAPGRERRPPERQTLHPPAAGQRAGAWLEADLQTCCATSAGGLLTFGEIPASCLKCWLILAVFLAMLWELMRWILSLMLSCSLFLYLSAEIRRGGGLSAEVRGQKRPAVGKGLAPTSLKRLYSLMRQLRAMEVWAARSSRLEAGWEACVCFWMVCRSSG